MAAWRPLWVRYGLEVLVPLTSLRKLRAGSRAARLVLATLATVSTVSLAGCKSDVDITVRARPEGSGTIRVTAVLDQEAAQWLGSPEKALATADLAKRGWAIRSVQPIEDGGVTFGAEQGFSTIDEGNRIIDDLTGPDGPFSKLRLSRSRSLLSTSIKLNGTVDLTKRLEAFGDDELATLLGGGSRIGVGEDELPLDAPVDELLTVKLTSELAGVSKVVSLPLGSTVVVSAAGQKWTWEAAAGFGGALAGLVALVAIRRARD